MINSHKELVNEILNWGKKMDFINETQYVTDVGNADYIVNSVEPRGFVFAPVDMSFGDDYNLDVNYGFTIVDKTSNDEKAIVNSETENMFCVSALDDYINQIADGFVNFQGIAFDNIQSEAGVLTSLSGFFTVSLKRSASYWKVMETYNAE